MQYTCANSNCDNTFIRNRSEAKGSKLLFCSISCSTSYYNAVRQGSIPLRKCKRVGCNNYIHTTNLKVNYCGGKCSRLFRLGTTAYTPESVTSLIQSFVNEHGRIPIRNEMGGLNRLARRFYGTWNKAIEEAGYSPNPVMYAKHYLAKDGHKCDSMAEKIVDDWLNSHKIEHFVHVLYPWRNGMKCDFLIDETWVEIFGLDGSSRKYKELKKQKLALIKKFKLRLIELSLKDAYEIDSRGDQWMQLRKLG